jgi:hypothetical protein
MSEIVKEAMKLPTKKIKASSNSPKKMLFFSKPKTGKTSILAELKDSLILDLENGTDFLDAVKVKVRNSADLKEVGEAIKAAGRPYKYIIVDTVTKLEDIALQVALQLYKATPLGKNFEGDNVLTLANGAGYLYQRMAMEKLLAYIETLADRIIYSGHIKTKYIEKNGKEVAAAEVDLQGKAKSMLCADMDAIGLLYRDGDKNIITFVTKDEVICGARPEYLRNAEIVLSEYIDGKYVTHWDKIFID